MAAMCSSSIIELIFTYPPLDFYEIMFVMLATKVNKKFELASRNY